jgi:hypothetical protein
MRSLASCLVVAAVLVSPIEAHAAYARYAVRATCARSGVVGIGADFTVAAAAQTAIAECRAAGAPGRCCRGNVKLWRLQ